MNVQEAYQVGLLDSLRGRESLASLLSVVGETELLLDYIHGLIVGERLQMGDDLSDLS